MPRDRVEAVERALTILNCFTSEQTELSLKQLAEKTGFYKSTILRLAGSLEHYGYLARHSNGRYRLGAVLIALGETARNNFDIATIIRPALESLRDRFNESVAYYTRSGNMRICLYRANANRSIRHQLEEGTRLPLDRGAAGRILMAYSNREGTLYNKIRERGWYASMGERDSEVASVGVPVLNSAGQILAALCISGPLSRFDQDRQSELAESLQEAAAELTILIGADKSPVNKPSNDS